MGLGGGVQLALPSGRSLADNIAELKAQFYLNKSGYFGTKGKGRNGTRNIASDNPSKTAWEFAHIAAYSPMGTSTIAGKGVVWTMRDGSVVSYRYYSSSSDLNLVVELKVHNVSGVHSQKIHFTKNG